MWLFIHLIERVMTGFSFINFVFLGYFKVFTFKLCNFVKGYNLYYC